MEVPQALRKWLIYVFLLEIVFDTQRHSVNAQPGLGGAGILVKRASFCFNNDLLYKGCNEAFRLDESGELKVPHEDTDRFCNGPCAGETELVLQCLNGIMSDYVFVNRASPRDVRNALRGGCGNSFSRGNFNVGDYAQGLFFGKANKKLPGLFVALVLGVAPLIM